jgi:hypothetical protein
VDVSRRSLTTCREHEHTLTALQLLVSSSASSSVRTTRSLSTEQAYQQPQDSPTLFATAPALTVCCELSDSTWRVLPRPLGMHPCYHSTYKHSHRRQLLHGHWYHDSHRQLPHCHRGLQQDQPPAHGPASPVPEPARREELGATRRLRKRQPRLTTMYNTITALTIKDMYIYYWSDRQVG